MKNLYKGFGFFILSAFLLTPFLSFAATNEGVATASNVLVVYNSAYTADSDSDSTQDSLELANYYKAKRSIPDANVVGIDTPTTLAITRSDYNSYIKSPLETYLTDNNLKDSIKYIVFIKGIPMKVYDTSGAANNYVNAAGNHSSVDASTMFLFQTNYSSTDGKIINPYFNADASLQMNNRFKSNTFGVDVKMQYLVTRLDGYTVADVKNMIDRATNTNKSGTGYFVLDRYSGGNNFNFDSMSNSAINLKNLGKNTYPDPFTKGNSAIKNISNNVMGYVSYGIYAGLGNDFYNKELNFSYLNGAVASTYESYTAFSNVEPDNTNFGQIYQFIRAGGSGGIGNVYEPFTVGIPNESIYLPAYSVGYTWADSAYMSIPVIDWTGIVIGDPLMRIVNDSISAPSVTTVSTSNITTNSVTLTGNISNTGGEDNSVRGFRYGITNSYGSFAKETGTFSTGNFSLNLTGLTCNTTYYYQAYSVNSLRAGYSTESTFKTSPCAVPIIATDYATDTTISSAKLNGIVYDIGLDTITERGFEFGTTNSYGSIVKQNGNFGLGGFLINATGLLCDTSYHYRAYATNSSGTGYGRDIVFKTSFNCAPTISTNNASIVSGVEYNLNADIKSVGGDAVTERGFEIGTTTNYGTTVKETGNFGGSFGYLAKFGSYGSNDGNFIEPRDVAVDSNGNIYVADRLNHRIQKFDSSGNFVTKWGSFGSSNSQFKYPRGIAVDSSNNIYVADSDNHKIKKFDSSGNYITSWGGYGTGNGKTSYPQDVVIDSNNNVYVSDYDNSRITKFSSTGTYIAKWGSYGSGDGQFKPAHHLSVDANNNIYVADRNNNRIQKFDSSGNYIMKFGSYGTGDGEFSLPSGILVDANGNIYVAEANHRLQKFDSSGNFLAKTGGAGNFNGSFIDPQGMAFDANGNIYVADSSNERIQKISTSGLFSLSVNSLSCGVTYNYRAYAINSIGTSYGANQTFTTPGCPITAPGTPTTVTPTKVKNPKFTWTASTSNSGLSATPYEIELSKDNTFGTGVTNATSTTNSYTTPNLSDGEWFVRVRAVDANNNISNYSEIGSVVIDTVAPSVVQNLTGPSTTTSTTPTLTWNNSTDNTGGVGMHNKLPYAVYYSQSSSFGSGVTQTNVASNSFTPASALAKGTWYFKVRARDMVANATVSYSNTATVTIQ
jgi:uncharacterized protein (TIGR03790 family)